MPAVPLVARPSVVALLLLASVAVTGVALALFWPLGVVLGLTLGAGAVLAVGLRMELTERVQPADDDLAARLGIRPEPLAAPTTSAPTTDVVLDDAAPTDAAPDDLRQGVLYFTSDDDPDRAEARTVVQDAAELKERLGADYPDFARAARLVVSTQYASAARLQRELDLPYARARRLLADLEQQHFVGPATASLPRQVLMPKERLPEVERLLAEV